VILFADGCKYLIQCEIGRQPRGGSSFLSPWKAALVAVRPASVFRHPP
jgi:hypothetical protein